VLLDLDWSTCEMRYLHQDVLPRNKTRAHRQIMSSLHYIIRCLQESKVVFVTCSNKNVLSSIPRYIFLSMAVGYTWPK